MTTPLPLTSGTGVTSLSDYIEALKRELAVPGEFATTFPNTTDDDLVGTLADGFAECQLDGFFISQTVDPNVGSVTPALSSGGAALIVIYSGIRVIRSQLRNLKTTQIYEAAGVKYEVQTAATVLTEELKDFRARREQILALVLRQLRSKRAVYVGDGYLTRSRGYFPIAYGGEFGSFYGYETIGFGNGAFSGFGI